MIFVGSWEVIFHLFFENISLDQVFCATEQERENVWGRFSRAQVGVTRVVQIDSCKQARKNGE